MDKDMEKLNEEVLDEVNGGIISGQVSGVVMGAQVDMARYVIDPEAKAGAAGAAVQLGAVFGLESKIM